MKSKKLLLLEKVLRLMAIAVLKKYKPEIIGITGSVGKTSTAEAIYVVLSAKHFAARNINNYNNEIGIPLAIIGAESGNKSAWKWLRVFLHWLKIMVLPTDYPKILILELGVDAPGDMKYLLSFIPLKIGVFTSVSSVHLEHFKSIEQIASEKGRIIERLGENQIAILNADDEIVVRFKNKTSARVVTYGYGAKADLRASDQIYAIEDGQFAGVNFKINYEGKTVPVRLRHILAFHQVYAALAAAAIGIEYKMNLVEIATALERFCSPLGRMNLIQGLNNSQIIDDTYNSSPKSAMAALEVLNKLSPRRKIAVLGDMLELGSEEEKGHQEVARKVFEIGTDYFLAIGDRMKIALEELRRLKFPEEKMFWFEEHAEVAEKLKLLLQKGDMVLVKGSQSMRMEKIVEKIIKNPEKARNLLCRQSASWWKKPYLKP